VKILKAALAIMFGTAGWLSAQNPSPSNDAERLRVELSERARQENEQRDWDTRIFQIKYVDPGELQRALSMFRSSITYSGGGLRVLSVRAPKEIMPAIEDAIKRLDVPTPRMDAELTVYVLLGSDQPEAAGGGVPSALQPVVNQLKSLLSYKGYQLVDTLITRASTNRGAPARLSGMLKINDNLTPTYDFQSRYQFDNQDGKTPVVRLMDMQFNLRMPNPQTLVGISGDVEIPQGRQVVVGKTTMGDRALILVMSSKFSN